MISPVRPRANASGLTRMRVRSIRFLSSGQALVRRGLFRAAPAGRAGRRLDLGLAVRADPPGGVQRARAARARVLELAHAAGAAQEVALDLRVAVGAQLEPGGVQAGLGRLHLELALADV